MKMQQVGEDEQGSEVYKAENGYTMRREYTGLTPNGNPMSGRWVLRNAAGELVDFHQYRHDLLEHNNFRPAY